MTRQDKIREGIARAAEATWYRYDHNVVWDEIAKSVVSYLHSQGVVIRADRELPTKWWDEFIEHDWVDITLADKSLMKGMLKAGFVAVEPLIKEQYSIEEVPEIKDKK